MTNHIGQRQLTFLRWTANGMGLACVLLIVGAGYEVHHLLRQKCKALEQQRQADRTLIASADNVRAQHAGSEQQLRSLNEELSELKTRLPTAPNEAEFLAQLSTLSERSV